jgi:hypothetical protein
MDGRVPVPFEPEGASYMRQRPIMKFHPGLERFEAKQLLSASASAAGARAAALKDGSAALAAHPAATPDGSPQARATGPRGGTAGAGYIAYRITNPTYRIVHLIPPFQHVLVQRAQPVPGKVYNVLFVVVKNGTGKTFTAGDGLTVRLPGFTGTHRVTDSAFPVLTGNQTWAPNQWIVFYVLSKKYYPLSPQVAAGFQLQAGGRSSTMVPGPSGIFLRLKYDPATFARTLDWIVAFGQGAELGKGARLGIGDTAINLLVSAGTNRQDFAGHF